MRTLFISVLAIVGFNVAQVVVLAILAHYYNHLPIWFIRTVDHVLGALDAMSDITTVDHIRLQDLV